MKNIYLLALAFSLSFNVLAWNVTGTATNAETGDSLSGFDILLTYTTGGIVTDDVTGSGGNFTLTGVEDGTYGLEFYTYPDPIILNGDYFVSTIYESQIVVNGGNISGIEFKIPPHHPVYTLTGVLYDAVTLDTITIQDFQVQAKMQYLTEFFFDYATENGTYILENLPDYTYEFTLFGNDYYEGEATDITIDPTGPDTVQMDFYLQPKMGETVSGVLLDSTTNQPVMQAGRSIKLQAINSLFTETNAQGEFTFINLPPGTYANISVTSQDTDYVNCTGSKITGFVVPNGGVSNVQLYQKPWISIHEVTADNATFEPGETKTVKFSIVNDDLSYGSIWGVNLIFPEGVTVLNSTSFYSYQNGEMIFDEIPDCGTDHIKAWEGWHFVGIPPYASSEGNLDVLNESAWANVTLEFADSASMQSAPVFFEIFYETHCFTIQPFSYGTIVLENSSGITESLQLKAMLEGAFNGTGMDSGEQSELPLSQPFNTEPWNYAGGESITSIPAGTVDWILIEIRDASSPETAYGNTAVARRAALIMADGSIVATDGSSNPAISATIGQNMYVVLWQRNHLGIMSNYPVTQTGGMYAYDFTTGADQAFGGSNPQKELTPGVWGMIAGDGNHDGMVDLLDFSTDMKNECGTEGYLNTDYTLDGQSDNRDKNDAWLPNLGRGTSIPD